MDYVMNNKGHMRPIGETMKHTMRETCPGCGYYMSICQCVTKNPNVDQYANQSEQPDYTSPFERLKNENQQLKFQVDTLRNEMRQDYEEYQKAQKEARTAEDFAVQISRRLIP